MTITDMQWRSIITNMLGLRSGKSSTDIDSAASYSMDMGCEYTSAIQILTAITPQKWDTLLTNTLEKILSFENSSKRYLLIVKPSHGGSFEYKDCFPKCSSKPTNVQAHTEINGKEITTLKQWVIENIPS